ncbi:zinc-finger domain-containing protein [Kangiella sediminilitoris]|uniref:Uncharacterized protein n=1 Tax=Kangiella sediminilitoris TaxID=1144748 RepID=A0A1B3B8N5_9GAMM|nr:zinc-finger domain-containing protein [Kangiella sediminilitoris]AOE49168.1 hypothetical protein KS2013_444 [Kangiella sediminilitoris]
MSEKISNQQANSNQAESSPQQRIEVTADDLPISCPMPGKTLWSQHPRVFIPVENGEGHCPYCGNHFIVKS